MSNTTTSRPANCSAVGFLFFPYRDMMGTPVFTSRLSLISAPASAVPRKPCSGANTFFTSTPSSSKASSKCFCCFSRMEVWFTTNPTRLSFNRRVTTSIRSAPNFRGSFCGVTAWISDIKNRLNSQKAHLITVLIDSFLTICFCKSNDSFCLLRIFASQ